MFFICVMPLPNTAQFPVRGNYASHYSIEQAH